MKRHEARPLDVFGDNWTMLDVTATLRDGLSSALAPDRFHLERWAWSEVVAAERAFRTWLSLLQDLLWTHSLAFASASAGGWMDDGAPLQGLTTATGPVEALADVPTDVDGLADGLVHLWFNAPHRERRRELIRRFQESGDAGDVDTARLLVGSPVACAVAETLDKAWAPHPVRATFVDRQLPRLEQLLKDDTGHEAQRTRRVLLHHVNSERCNLRRATVSLGGGAVQVILETSDPDHLVRNVLEARDALAANRDVIADLFGWCQNVSEPPEAGWEETLDTALSSKHLDGSDALSLTACGWLRGPLSTEDTDEPIPSRFRYVSGRVRADARLVEAAEHFVRLFGESRTSLGLRLVEQVRNACSARDWITL